MEGSCLGLVARRCFVRGRPRCDVHGGAVFLRCQ